MAAEWKSKKNNPHTFYVLFVEDETDWIYNFQNAAINVLNDRYGIKEASIEWDFVENRDDAIERIRAAQKDRPGRVYDVIFCDLHIPESKGMSKLSVENGFAVLRAIADADPIGRVVVLSGFSNLDSVLATKNKDFDGIIRIDDWLDKAESKNPDDDRSTAEDSRRAKLERCLVPVFAFAERLRTGSPALLVRHPKMLEMLRDLVFHAKRDYPSWPLAKMLLLGPMGSGKGAMARAFWSLLPENEMYERPYIGLNCASVVSEGHGGRIAFFGAEGFGNGVADQPGVFERASSFKKTGPGELSKGEEPNVTRAGVVFLDEFAELSPDLQASILTALEEGVIRREGSGKLVNIACHVVLATNYPIEKLTDPEGTVRQDLLDRIPLVFEIPSLVERRSELSDLLIHLVRSKLRQFNPNCGEDVMITKSASQLIDKSVRMGIIKSVRKLQSIADVLEGESRITDANLGVLFQTARVLGLESELVEDDTNLSLAEKVKTLCFPEELWQDGLPSDTAWVIDQMYDHFLSPHRHILLGNKLKELPGSSEERILRFMLVTELWDLDIDKHDNVRKSAIIGTVQSQQKARGRVYRKIGLNHWPSGGGKWLASERVKRRELIFAYLKAEADNAQKILKAGSLDNEN